MNHIERARELFLKGYNCSQSVFCTFAEEYGIPMEQALRLSASFGGGIGRMRETCGAVCGMAMLAGMETGQTNPNDPAQKQTNYHAVQDLAEQFRQINGSIKCAELLQLRKDAPITSVPEQRTEEYYHKRPCLRMVETAVELFEEFKKKNTVSAVCEHN